MELKLAFGTLGEPLAEQLSAQGIEFEDDRCGLWQRLHDSVCLLAIHGCVSDSEHDLVERLIVKLITRDLEASLSEPAV